MPPTLALPFLLREKEAKAYLRGFPLDIPWGLCPRSNRKAVTLPPHLLRKSRAPLGDRRGPSPLLLEIQKPGGFLVYLCLLSLHKKVGAVWSAQLHKKHIRLNIKKSLHRSCRDFFIYPSLPKQFGPDLWHQRVFTHRYIVTKVFCLFSVPQTSCHHNKPRICKLIGTGGKG